MSPSMDDVLTAVAAADAVVACVGEGAYAEKPGDINTLDLPGGQVQVCGIPRYVVLAP